MNKPAVALFGFNRPDCTEAVFEEIRRHRPQKLFLVADGPRGNVPTDKLRCEAVRETFRSVDWDCEVRTHFSDYNLGCKKRISSGIDWVFSQVEEAIILEDDCVPCPDFFKFCAEMLARYRSESRVMHVGGHNFQKGQKRGEASYYFSRYVHVWGWATWRRAWKCYDVNMAFWPQIRRKGPFQNYEMDATERAYWTTMFDLAHAGKIGTWDYQWVHAVWQNRGLSITPNVNLVTNIGASPEATHTKGPGGSLAIPVGKLDVITHPARIIREVEADSFTFDDHYDGRTLRLKPGLKLWLKWRRSIEKRRNKILQLWNLDSRPSR